MCTNVTIRADVEGSAKGAQGWMKVDAAYVSFDHPQHAPFDHSLNIDFVAEASAGVQRVAVELSAASARLIAEKIIEALAQGEAEAGMVADIGAR
jgi:hypothetical protein